MPKGRKDTPPAAASSPSPSSTSTTPTTRQTKLDDMLKSNSPKKEEQNEEIPKTQKTPTQQPAAEETKEQFIDPALIRDDTEPYSNVFTLDGNDKQEQIASAPLPNEQVTNDYKQMEKNRAQEADPSSSFAAELSAEIVRRQRQHSRQDGRNSLLLLIERQR
jgi:hypothetical protein